MFIDILCIININIYEKKPYVSVLTAGLDFYFDDKAEFCHLQCLFTLQLGY